MMRNVKKSFCYLQLKKWFLKFLSCSLPLNTYHFPKISQCSQVNNDFKIFGIIENSWEFPLILIGVFAIPNNSHKFQRQFPPNLELLKIPSGVFTFHPFPSIPKYSKVFYLSSFACLEINWNSYNSGNSFCKGLVLFAYRHLMNISCYLWI